ncbi:MAG TPA: redoxin domain-containing protein, partial [Chromatiales bacterium]|nr:redoxin domain-containing protein [Chromatiales bacterium]
MRPGPGRIAILMLLPILVLFSAVASAAEPQPDDPRIEPVSASEFGKLLQARHRKVVLVNFWATWCRSCLEEIPALMDLADRFRSQGFELVAVSLDDPDSLQSVVLPFMDKWFPAFSSYLSTERDMDAMVSILDPAWN